MSIKTVKITLLALILAFCFSAKARAASYDFYVDASNTGTEDGTIDHPYNTISEALEVAEANDKKNRKIFVKKGTYEERIDLEEGVKIYGESKKKTVIKGGGSYTVRMKNGSSIKKISVKKGSAGILVESKAAVTIKDCIISGTKSRAIDIDGDKSGKKRKVEIKNCEIRDNKGKGIYIQHGRSVKIKGNDISKNNGEGIDMHSKAQRAVVKGSITKNKISKNKESGIELVAGKTNLRVENNKIKNNRFSGISNQFINETKKGSFIKIARNIITGNDHFGVNCENLRGGKAPQGFWNRSLEFVSNVFHLNIKGETKPVCLN
jgi:parallel beta-helix repeat protein